LTVHRTFASLYNLAEYNWELISEIEVAVIRALGLELEFRKVTNLNGYEKVHILRL
jgi:hypothetical protein